MAGKGPYKIDGYIFFENGLPATGVITRLYNRGFGRAATKLGEITTDVNGYYAIAYGVSKGSANLEVRVVDAHGKEVTICDTRHDADANESLNLVAPTTLRPVAPEYERLTQDLAKELGGLTHLREAKEDEDQQDLSLLSSSTGWDARLIALAVAANQLAPESGMQAEVLYALYRAGLSLDKNQLARTRIEEVEDALKSAVDADILKLEEHAQAAAKSAFQKFALATLHSSSAHGTVSSFSELLVHSGLSAAEQAKFEQIYFAQGSDADGLWDKVEKLGISKQAIESLQLQGKLYYLTMNNAPLAEYLQKQVGALDKLPALADRDFYLAKPWKDQLAKLAGNDAKKLAALIPSTYGADTTEERLEAYANDLARRIRMSYSTYVIARMLETQDMPHGSKRAGAHTSLARLLRNAAALGFELGRTAVESFVCKNKSSLLVGIKAEDAQDLFEDLKRLQRLYQITPSDESLKVLLESGLKSAHDVARMPYQAFARRFGRRFPSLQEAELVYRKAHQVKGMVLSHHQMAKSAASSPGMFATSPPPDRRKASKANMIEHFPNMETLFGSLDYCECSDCRSVLSPAAYLVDILQFLDPHPASWQSFLELWKSEHGNAPYPFQDQSQAKNQSAKLGKGRHRDSSKNEKTPYEVFIERRPDIPHLPLTCENTNVAMPYIDVVNEIFEYFVAHDSLSADSGHDTGKSTSEELFAEPHNVLPLAYDKLRHAKYPSPLPFDLWLETVRRFVNHFDVKLAEILEIFRPSNDLFPPATNHKRYYRANIFAESLGLSPSEYSLFTDTATHNHWFELCGYESASEASQELSSAKTLAQRLFVDYRELVSLVNTWFVNPNLHALVVLEKIEMELEEVLRYKNGGAAPKGCTDSGEAAAKEEKQEFADHFTAASLQNLNFDVKAWLDKAWQDGNFNRALVLSNVADPCDFAETSLAYVDGTAADAAVFLRLHLFVRLRKKLGWSIEELDRALQVAIPKNDLPLTLANMGAAFTTALLYLSHFKALEERTHFGKDARLKLLILWNDIFTTGRNSMYSQLFLRNSSLRNEPDYQRIFDDPLGNYLSQSGVMLQDNLIAVQAALNLTASDIESILVDAGSDVSTATLTLDTVSLLYRYGLLAKSLTIPVADLIALKAMSGLNPFQPLKPDPVTTLDDDYPYSQTLRFVEVAETVRDSGFKIEDLNYLLRHQFDPVGKYREDPNALLRLVKTLAAGLRSIQTEQAVPADVNTLTDEMLMERIALVLPADAATVFTGMWNGTVEYDAAQTGIAPANQLDPTAFAQMPAVNLSYDSVLQAQKLSYHGVLTDTQSTQLQAANGAPTFAALLAAVKAQGKTFYDKYLCGFLSPKDYQDLFTSPPAGATDAQTQAAVSSRRVCLAQRLFPFVQQQLSRQFVVQTLTSTLGADSSVVQTLLTTPWLLTDPRTANAQLLNSFLALGQSAVDFAAFSSNDESGAPLSSAAQTLAATDTTNQKPAGTNSVQIQGYFEVPATGPYRFFALLGKQGAQAQLTTDQAPTPLIQGTAASDGMELSQFIDLKAGVPYFFTFTAGNLNSGDVSLSIQGESLPKNAMSSLTLYAKSSVDQVGRAWMLLSKTFQFINRLPLDELELRYLLSNAADFDNVSFSQLPCSAPDATAGDPTVLFHQFLRLAGYAKLKADIGDGGDDLIAIFQNAQQSYPASTDPTQAQTQMLNTVCQKVANLTRRELATVQSAAMHLGMAPHSAVSGSALTVVMPDLRQEKGLHKLWRALNVTQKLGVSVDAVARWATPSPDFDIARAVRHSVKARYERESWLVLAPTIFDKLRQHKRDALVAYIMQRNGFEDRNQLFEYFLVDPGMEPIVQTSRLRLAISAVQTFVQRCFLNLEPEVQPAALCAEDWDWMKRYRVWEANREIFLFPENWLEPEFRDDKTDLFQELEGTLLQGDISNDLAEDALFTYLKKLEQIARLEIVSIYSEQDLEEVESNILHVIGRTRNDPRQYFYRNYENQMWTPWEEISTQFDGDHIVAVVWRNRLNVFWLTFADKNKQNNSDNDGSQKVDPTKPISIPTTVPYKEVDVQLNWSEYFQGEWTTRGSSGFGSPIAVIVEAAFDKKTAFVHGEVSNENGTEVARINLHFDCAFRVDAKFSKPSMDPFRPGLRPLVPGPLDFAFEVISKNAPPQVVPGRPAVEAPFPRVKAEVNHYVAPKALQVSYVESIQQIDKNPPVVQVAKRDILTNADDWKSDELTLCPTPAHSDLPNVGVLVTPFFYEDRRHVFYVEPSLTETVIDKWEHWAIPFPHVATKRGSDKNPRIVASFPKDKPPKTLPPNVRPFNGVFGPGERFHLQIAKDPTTDDQTDVHYGGQAIGGSGRKGPVKAPAAIAQPKQRPAAKGSRR